MRKSESLILSLFIFLIALICAGAIYVWAVPKAETAQDGGDRYPTSIAVLDTIHRDSFRAIKAAGYQKSVWVEDVDWGLTGGQVSVAVASDDKSMVEKLKEILLRHGGVVHADVRLVPDLQRKAAAALKSAGLDKFAFVSAMTGRVPQVTFASSANDATTKKVLAALQSVPGVMAGRTEKLVLGDLAKTGNKALADQDLDKRALVDRADGRDLYVQVAGADKDLLVRVKSVLGKVHGVRAVHSTAIDLKGDKKVENRAGCQILFSALKARNKIQFAVGSAKIDASSNRLLDRLVDAARRCAGYRIEISGHTDNTGDLAANMRLSASRANAVVDYLAENGVARSRMTAKGMGPHRPIADNNTEAGKARNRRIEFTILRSGKN